MICLLTDWAFISDSTKPPHAENRTPRGAKGPRKPALVARPAGSVRSASAAGFPVTNRLNATQRCDLQGSRVINAANGYKRPSSSLRSTTTCEPLGRQSMGIPSVATSALVRNRSAVARIGPRWL